MDPVSQIVSRACQNEPKSITFLLDLQLFWIAPIARIGNIIRESSAAKPNPLG